MRRLRGVVYLGSMPIGVFENDLDPPSLAPEFEDTLGLCETVTLGDITLWKPKENNFKLRLTEFFNRSEPILNHETY